MHSRAASDSSAGPRSHAAYPERQELFREYPSLEEEDLRQALGFAAANLDDRVDILELAS